jgi:serine/threonine protein kinase
MLVFEDAGGEPLQRLLLDPPMEVGRFLRRAIGIAMALGKPHERGLVHKDIKPVNILVNGATGDARLTGSTLHLASPASDRRASLPLDPQPSQDAFVRSDVGGPLVI